jgi:hypothetical protein
VFPLLVPPEVVPLVVLDPLVGTCVQALFDGAELPPLL